MLDTPNTVSGPVPGLAGGNASGMTSRTPSVAAILSRTVFSSPAPSAVAALPVTTTNNAGTPLRLSSRATDSAWLVEDASPPGTARPSRPMAKAPPVMANRIQATTMSLLLRKRASVRRSNWDSWCVWKGTQDTNRAASALGSPVG